MSTATPSAAARSAVSPADLATLLFLGAVWGGAFLFMRIAAPEVGALWLAESRVALAALVLVAIAGRRTLAAMRGRVLAFVFLGATFSAIPFTLISFAALTLPASFGALLNASTPLFTALVAAAWIGQRMPTRVAGGLLVGLVAVVVLVGWSPLALGPETLLAVGAALAGAFSYAVAGTHVKRALHGVGGVELATGQLVTASLLILPFAILSGPPGIPSVAGAASIGALAVVSTAVAWPLFFGVLGRTGPTAASTVTFIVPAFGILWGGLVLGEHIGLETAVGFGLVLVSLVLVLGVRVPAARPNLPSLGAVRRALQAA